MTWNRAAKCGSEKTEKENKFSTATCHCTNAQVAQQAAPIYYPLVGGGAEWEPAASRVWASIGNSLDTSPPCKNFVGW